MKIVYFIIIKSKIVFADEVLLAIIVQPPKTWEKRGNSFCAPSVKDANIGRIFVRDWLLGELKLINIIIDIDIIEKDSIKNLGNWEYTTNLEV